MTNYEKHAKLTRPALGQFGRTELALLGTPCGHRKQLAYTLARALTGGITVAYVDADHKGEDTVETIPALSAGALAVFTDKITFTRLDTTRPLNEFQRRPLFADYDLVLVNGNHFTAQAQIVVVDPAKSLEKKLDRLTNVQLVLIKDTETIPDFLREKLPAGVPVLPFDQTDRIADFVRAFVDECRPPLLGLVLTGGQSTRMGQDKATLDYHGLPQRDWITNLMKPYCEDVFWSVNARQAIEVNGLVNPFIADSFLGLGPMGGILSAFRQQPDAAWLVVACDLPLLTSETLDALVNGRNPSTMATAFLDSDAQFPEPLLSIWEPRAYPVLLQFLAMGYSCPRKALINGNITLLQAPDVQALTNANDPETKETVKKLILSN